MKKSIIFGLILSLGFMVFSACDDNTSPVNEPSFLRLSDGTKLPLNVQYIRTNGYDADAKYPIITVIFSRTELEQYYDNNKDKYDLSTRSSPIPSDSSIGFIDAIENYSDEYFSDNFLLIVLLEEGSGSIRHKVESIDENGDVVISRLSPGLGTCDMAEWHILIELNDNYKKEQYQVLCFNKEY